MIKNTIHSPHTTTYSKTVEVLSRFFYTVLTEQEGIDVMEIEIKIDPTCREPKIFVLTESITEEVNELVKRLSTVQPQLIAGFQGDQLELIEPTKILRAFSANQKVFISTDNGEYTVRLRLYELEERLTTSLFVRISNSEIINLKKVKGFDLSFSGTICVKLIDGTVTYVSRRFVSKIKQVLGI